MSQSFDSILKTSDKTFIKNIITLILCELFWVLKNIFIWFKIDLHNYNCLSNKRKIMVQKAQPKGYVNDLFTVYIVLYAFYWIM